MVAGDGMRPIFQKFPFLIPIAGVVFLVLSPLIMPLVVIARNGDDVREYFQACLSAIRNERRTSEVV
jgi:hypothetical protein